MAHFRIRVGTAYKSPFIEPTIRTDGSRAYKAEPSRYYLYTCIAVFLFKGATIYYLSLLGLMNGKSDKSSIHELNDPVPFTDFTTDNH